MIFIQRPVNYEQTDSRWKNIMYSNHGDKKQTIGTSGCGPTCAAMVISEITGKAVYPPETCKWSSAHGFRTDNNGTSWGYFKPQMAAYGITCSDTISDVNKAVAALEKGKLVIALALKGLWTSSGHYILAYAVKDGTVYINDPNGASKEKEEAKLSIFRQHCTKFWIVEDDWMIDKREIKVDVDGKEEALTSVLVENENYIRLRDIAPVLGYSVGYDATKKMPLLKKEKE